MAPAHDPFAPARRPHRSGLLPEAFEAGARSAGADDDEMARIREHWWRGTPGQRASAEEMIAEFTPGEWVEFLDGWRRAMADPDFDPWDGMDDQEATSGPSEAQDSRDGGDAGDDTNAPTVTVIGPDGTISEHFFAELVDMGPPPDGWVAAGWTRPAGDVNGEPMAVGMHGYVPIDAKDALAFLAGDAEGGTTEVPDTDDHKAARARLVLAAELARPAAGRRKKVLAAVAAVVGDDEVAEQTTAASEGLGG